MPRVRSVLITKSSLSFMCSTIVSPRMQRSLWVASCTIAFSVGASVSLLVVSVPSASFCAELFYSCVFDSASSIRDPCVAPGGRVEPDCPGWANSSLSFEGGASN